MKGIFSGHCVCQIILLYTLLAAAGVYGVTSLSGGEEEDNTRGKWTVL